ncbi:DUF6387 family protein [Methylotenera sp.]|uniref:DUF6387 family protein n=1 Tax=Methylotenera sp. TaxID=2051956 RepID=UPI00272070A3|nr:DUF6387 family protein [Methylotenera sp.]MDO9205293.1 DUF6387 family protein [Methylotenera sp.]MDP2072304.1 DUF6387 family protein [Methylotenera sp.]MDP3005103.1 DUF6387 family protein [Methylotenera sp.]
MSIKSIKHFRELPSWFILEKYDAAKTLDAAGWYEQLLVRHDIRKYLKSNISDVIKNQFMLLQKSPIIYVDDSASFGAFFLTDKLYELKAKKPNYSLGVHRLTVQELYLIENNIEGEKRTYARNYFRNRFNMFLIPPLDFPDDYPFKPWLDEPVSNINESQDSHIHVSVDMGLPDKALIEQFKRLLINLRSPLQQVGVSIDNKLRPDFDGWAKFGVLPYLDLSIWAEIEGVKIPNRVMADAIFPEGEGGEEVVRKTTQKLADETLTESHLNKLAALAAHEIAERNTD